MFENNKDLVSQIEEESLQYKAPLHSVWNAATTCSCRQCSIKFSGARHDLFSRCSESESGCMTYSADSVQSLSLSWVYSQGFYFHFLKYFSRCQAIALH